MKTIKNLIPTYWSNRMLYQFREEDKAIEKIKKANLTEEQKINSILLIYNGLSNLSGQANKKEVKKTSAVTLIRGFLGISGAVMAYLGIMFSILDPEKELYSDWGNRLLLLSILAFLIMFHI